MTKIKLFIATSIDGYIAREDGALDWLYAIPNPGQTDHGYADFYKEIDTVIMGRTTYEEILGFGVEWPYPDCQTYVVTSDEFYEVKTPNTSVLNRLKKKTIEPVKGKSKSNIWVVGGGKIITAFLNLGLIDEMLLSIIPTILGRGIPLFPDAPKETLFELENAETFETGVVNLIYRGKPNQKP
ncbi:dihydrofolate reductase family protein [Marinilabilia rubra]|uniref:Dihydrofolate reductase n=1 Tax=Marinilabilia rubra TaxID=2162893 RepID=A0A2U2B9G6_9BACT|nr:dihydrofolate reductase family protein [Marinilabilia rubra]PWD99692.1 dihydrofolate reductase [Marinilabilia rubra]